VKVVAKEKAPPPNREDGRWSKTCTYIERETGKKKIKTLYSTISEADAIRQREEFKINYKKETEELAEKAKQANSPTAKYDNMTLAQWMKDWLYKIKVDTVRTNSWERYESLNRIHVVPKLGNMKLKDIKPVHISDFLVERKSSPVCKKKNPTEEDFKNAKRLSKRSIQYLFVMLNAAFDKAVKFEIVDKNPCASLDKPKLDESEIVPFEDEEVKRFLELASKHELYAFFVIAWYTGCRSSELLNLRWNNVDLDEGFIVIEEATMQTRQGTIDALPKTNSSYRRLDLPSDATQTLKTHKEVQDKQKDEFGIKYQGNNYVFCQEDGSLIPNYEISKQFKKLALQAGMSPSVRFHDMRHTHATMLFRLGFHPYEIQAQGGWATAKIAQRYTHLTYKDRQGIANKLEEKMKQIKNTNTSMLSNCCQTATDLTTK
jgi:integrase